MEEEEEEQRGSPAWMATFADLMSLLMCFFVLLLSFSEMDVAKYKQIAGSMRHAFGVQNDIKVKSIPKGTSIIAKEFSPGRPEPTPIKTVQQVSANTISSSLDVRSLPPGEIDTDKIKAERGDVRRMLEERQREVMAEAAKKLKGKLDEHIEDGSLDVEFDESSITIRVHEQGSFPSGSANLQTEFMPIIPILQNALKETPGAIAIEGHTDDVPISTPRFRSNWELSSHRALSFAHALLKDPEIDQNRFMIVGFADSKPRLPNDSWTNRAQNRRVEIVIRRDPLADLELELEQNRQEDS